MALLCRFGGALRVTHHGSSRPTPMAWSEARARPSHSKRSSLELPWAWTRARPPFSEFGTLCGKRASLDRPTSTPRLRDPPARSVQAAQSQLTGATLLTRDDTIAAKHPNCLWRCVEAPIPDPRVWAEHLPLIMPWAWETKLRETGLALVFSGKWGKRTKQGGLGSC